MKSMEEDLMKSDSTDFSVKPPQLKNSSDNDSVEKE